MAIIGGGNVALDAARTALRLGADEASIYYRRSRDEMPVTEVEYDEAIAEGIQVNFLVSPTRIVSDDWKVTGLQCIKMELGEPDSSGRRRPVPIEGSEFIIETDLFVVSIGAGANPLITSTMPDLELNKWEGEERLRLNILDLAIKNKA